MGVVEHVGQCCAHAHVGPDQMNIMQIKFIEDGSQMSALCGG